MFNLKSFFAIISIIPILIACQPAGEMTQPIVNDSQITVDSVALKADRLCNGGFFPLYLDFMTTNQYEPVNMYDSNGAGVAANDLDQDGDIDLVFANLAGTNQIFWNNGLFRFSSTPFPHGSSRAVATVDVDGDSYLDIVFTTRVGSLLFWRNIHDGSDFPFEQVPLNGIQEKAYAMNWADLDRDGDLDVVTGSYDTALDKELRDSFMMGEGAGVFVFENDGGNFTTQARLAETSQALAIALMDVNNDGRDDILVGNDFDSVPDGYWVAAETESGWEEAAPFTLTTQNTMSFDMGDVNNDGRFELFAADMHPYKFDDETNAAWAPAIEGMMGMMADPSPDNPQRMENMLQTVDESGQFTNIAPDTGVAFSGWSWSSRFGDLDQDGFLDLYIVNGMITAETFSHMPNFELVEENQAFRNDGNGGFVAAPKWGLGATESGRGMTMADLDQDGDLDIIINNLLSQAVIYENRTCSGNSLQVLLQDSTSANTHAIGGRLILQTAAGQQIRQIDSVAGYLSAPPSQAHFGIPQTDEILSLTIEWPDGQTTVVEEITPNYQLTISR